MSTSPEFLQERLAELLASPHISFPKPPPGLLGGRTIHMGHGPVDLFTTRFVNGFTSDAHGTVNGREVDFDGLKQALLALQRKWNPDTAQFAAHADAAGAGDKPATRFTWAQRDGGHAAEVTATASVAEEGGAPRISHLTLEGDESLFQSSKSS